LFTAFFFFKKESRGTKKFWGQKFFYLFKSIETATSVEFPSFVPHVICKLILDYTVFGLHTRVGQDGPVINRKWGPEGIVYQVFFIWPHRKIISSKNVLIVFILKKTNLAGTSGWMI